MNDDLQRTEDWKNDRTGCFTGSVMADLVARNKKTGAKLAAFDALVWKVVAERLSGKPIEGPNGLALAWGREVEPFAIERYELETGKLVTPVGFVRHPKYPFIGASADGLVGNDGAIEAKCPKDPVVHLERFISGVPEEFEPQIQTEILVNDREWLDFISADPRQSPEFQFLKIRCHRDEKMIALIEQSCLEAEEMAQSLIERLRRIAS